MLKDMIEVYKKSDADELKRYGFKIDTSDNDMIQFKHALNFIEKIDFSKIKNIADIGSGSGHQALLFSQMGLNVTCIDYIKPLYNLDYIHPEAKKLRGEFDAVWSHHCLEHIMNPIGELIKWHKLLIDNGKLFITVPECSYIVSSGHINSYSIPMLMYHLAISGYDCSEACFDISGSQIRAVAKKQSNYLPYTKPVTSLVELANYGLFPKTLTISINQNLRMRSEDIVLKYFGVTRKPRRNSALFYQYAINSVWS